MLISILLKNQDFPQMNERMMPIRLSTIAAKCVLRIILCIPAMFITASDAKESPKAVTVSYAEKVADGRPWHVNVVERAEKLEMTLFPDGSGVTDDLIVPAPKWRPTPDGFCLKPSALIREHCVTLVTRPNGYDGIENGKLFIELRR
jgi:hypothetical protein